MFVREGLSFRVGWSRGGISYVYIFGCREKYFNRGLVSRIRILFRVLV